MKRLQDRLLTLGAGGSETLDIGDIGARGAYMRFEGGDATGAIQVADEINGSNRNVCVVQPALNINSWGHWVWVPVLGDALAFQNFAGTAATVQVVLWDEPPASPQGRFGVAVLDAVVPAASDVVVLNNDIGPFWSLGGALAGTVDETTIEMLIGLDSAFQWGPFLLATSTVAQPSTGFIDVRPTHPLVTLTVTNSDAGNPSTVRVLVVAGPTV